MFDMASITKRSRVLDVAAGAGEQSLAAAKRVGDTGDVMATDLSPVILQFANSSAKLSGLSEKEQDEARDEIESALVDFEQDGLFEGSCEMLIALGTK
jgi:ubiquinone/menaquinone biosynthesis C-methylase UbiE